MTCLPGKIHHRFSNETYERRFGSEEQEEIEEQVECHICNKMLKPASLRKHLERQHNVYSNFFDEYKDVIEERDPVHYHVQSLGGNGYSCPVEGCSYGGGTTTSYSLRRHFSTRHECDSCSIGEEGSYPRCERCNMQVNAYKKKTWESHWKSATCKRGNERRLQRKAWTKAA